MNPRAASAWLHPVAGLLACALLASCQLNIQDFTERACDAQHACLGGYQCVQSVCTLAQDVPETETLRVQKQGAQCTYALSQDQEATWSPVATVPCNLTVERAGPFVANADAAPVTSATFGALDYPGSSAVTLALPAGANRDCWISTFTCLNQLQPVPGTDGTYQIDISDPVLGGEYQTTSLYFWQDNSNFLRFEFWSDHTGTYAQAWSVLKDVGMHEITGPKVTLSQSDALRVVKSGTSWVYQFSLDGGATWQTAGTFTAFLNVSQAGPAVSNTSATAPVQGTFGALQFPGSGALSLTAPAGSVHNCGAGTFGCTFSLQPVPGGDGTYQLPVRNLALQQASQSAGLMLFQDSDNFVRFELETQGSGVFASAQAIVGGVASPAIVGPSVTLGALPQTPAAASSLTAVAVSATSVQLSWLDNATNETGFRILRRPTQTSDPLAQVAQVAADSTSYLDTGLNNTWQYDYQVVAFNAVGDAGPSNSVTIQVLAP